MTGRLTRSAWRTDPRSHAPALTARRHLFHVALIAVGFLVASSGVAWAYFSGTASGTYAVANAGALAAPTALTSSATTTSSITISWTDSQSVPAPLGYVVYRCSGATCTPTTADLITDTASGCHSTLSIPLATTSCTDSGLRAATTYGYAVAAVYHTWQSPLSATFTATSSRAIPTFVQNASSTTTTVKLPNTVASGDALILVASVTRGAHHTVTAVSGGGVSWQLAQHAPTTTSTAAVAHTDIWYGLASTGASKIITLTVTGLLNIADVSEWSHVKAFKTTVKNASKNPNPNPTVTTGAVTPTAAGELLIAGAGITAGGSTADPKTPFTKFANTSPAPGNEGFSAYYVDPNTTSVAATWQETTTAKKWSGAIAGFSSDPRPVVSKVTPSSGPTAGGTAVAISGENFTPTSMVMFGSTPAASVTVNGPTSLTAISPPHVAGKVDVGVTNLTGTSAKTSADAFTYVNGSLPTVTGVSPGTGTTAGGTSVRITGTKFTKTATVRFGQTSATTVQFVNTTSITAVSPPHGPGTVPVSVTTTKGTSATSSSDLFTYTASTPPPAPAPTVTGITPGTGTAAGGTTVTITGTGFTTTTTVTFGTTAATSVTVTSTTALSVVTPAHPIGTVTVTVTTKAGSASTSFTYTTGSAS